MTLPGETYAAWNEAQVTDEQGHLRVIVDPSWGEALRLYVYDPEQKRRPTMHVVDAAAGRASITIH